MRTVFLTGATGFIGRHLAAALRRQGVHVTALIRTPASPHDPAWTSVVGDLRDPSTYRDALGGADVVIHAAAVTSPAQRRWFQTVNVQGTVQLLQACRARGVQRFIFMSSAAVLMAEGPYSDSKRAAEDAVRRSGLAATILRPAQVYGPGDRQGLARLIALVRGRSVIPVLGRGDATLQPLYVGDLAAAVLALLEDARSTGQTYVLAGPAPVRLLEIIAAVEAALGLSPRRRLHLPMGGVRFGAAALDALCLGRLGVAEAVNRLTASTRLDISPAQAALGFSPRTLAEGLSLTFTALNTPPAAPSKVLDVQEER